MAQREVGQGGDHEGRQQAHRRHVQLGRAPLVELEGDVQVDGVAVEEGEGGADELGGGRGVLNERRQLLVAPAL